MLKKLLGLAQDAEKADAAEAQDAAPGHPPTPDRPWLSIAFSLADLDCAVRVRRFAESLADRAANPDSIFAEFGECDDGLVTVLVHKKIEALPTMDAEAERIFERLLAEVSVELARDDYVAVATESEAGSHQFVMTAGDDEPRLMRFLVRDGDLVERGEIART